VLCNFTGSTEIPVEFKQSGPKSLDLPPPSVRILKVITCWETTAPQTLKFGQLASKRCGPTNEGTQRVLDGTIFHIPLADSVWCDDI